MIITKKSTANRSEKVHDPSTIGMYYNYAGRLVQIDDYVIDPEITKEITTDHTPAGGWDLRNVIHVCVIGMHNEVLYQTTANEFAVSRAKRAR
jgi:hypothetical protein